MGRPIPEKIRDAEVQCIDFWPADYAYFHAKSMTAVQNHGSATNTGSSPVMPEAGDSFSWRSGAELYDYTVQCAGYGGIVDGYMPVNDWFANQTPVKGTNTTRNFLFRVAACETYIVEDNKLREPTYKEVSELSDLMIDLAAELDDCQTHFPYQFVGGALFVNPYFRNQLSGESND